MTKIALIAIITLMIISLARDVGRTWSLGRGVRRIFTLIVFAYLGVRFSLWTPPAEQWLIDYIDARVWQTARIISQGGI